MTNLSDYVVNVIRTVVPVVVGTAIAWVAKRLGVPLDAGPEQQAAVAVCIVGYYALVRFVEDRVPAAGWLLGAPKVQSANDVAKVIKPAVAAPVSSTAVTSSSAPDKPAS